MLILYFGVGTFIWSFHGGGPSDGGGAGANIRISLYSSVFSLISFSVITMCLPPFWVSLTS